MPLNRALFNLGQVVGTPGALEALSRNNTTPDLYLRRHACGDWGDVDKHDHGANQDALENGSRLFSVYWLADESKLWVITEADRSVTTILLPSEY